MASRRDKFLEALALRELGATAEQRAAGAAGAKKEMDRKAPQGPPAKAAVRNERAAKLGALVQQHTTEIGKGSRFEELPEEGPEVGGIPDTDRIARESIYRAGDAKDPLDVPADDDIRWQRSTRGSTLVGKTANGHRFLLERGMHGEQVLSHVAPGTHTAQRVQVFRGDPREALNEAKGVAELVVAERGKGSPGGGDLKDALAASMESPRVRFERTYAAMLNTTNNVEAMRLASAMNSVVSEMKREPDRYEHEIIAGQHRMDEAAIDHTREMVDHLETLAAQEKDPARAADLTRRATKLDELRSRAETAQDGPAARRAIFEASMTAQHEERQVGRGRTVESAGRAPAMFDRGTAQEAARHAAVTGTPYDRSNFSNDEAFARFQTEKASYDKQFAADKRMEEGGVPKGSPGEPADLDRQIAHVIKHLHDGAPDAEMINMYKQDARESGLSVEAQLKQDMADLKDMGGPSYTPKGGGTGGRKGDKQRAEKPARGVEVGKRGGRFYTTASGKRIYLGSGR